LVLSPRLLESAFAGGSNVFRSLLLRRIFSFFCQAQLAQSRGFIGPLARSGIDPLIQALYALLHLGVAFFGFRSGYGHFLEFFRAVCANGGWLCAKSSLRPSANNAQNASADTVRKAELSSDIPLILLSECLFESLHLPIGLKGL
jgi:hypothetical protein